MEKLKIYVTILKAGILKNYHTEIEMGKNIKYRHKRLDRVGRYVSEHPEEFNKDSLCWDCSNYDRCPKILDINKKEITSYPFITERFQIRDLYHDENKTSLNNLDGLSSDEQRLREYDNLHIVKFLVNGCKNFKFK